MPARQQGKTVEREKLIRDAAFEIAARVVEGWEEPKDFYFNQYDAKATAIRALLAADIRTLKASQ